MIKFIPARNRHFSDFGWLKTYWLFSFADYHDPDNLSFGPLRVFNDDVVKPGRGFPPHQHEEMEIISIVLAGEITHKDSMGNKGVLKAGTVQRMSAGTGLTHSEYNGAEGELHFYQIWIMPSKSGATPSYDQRSFKHSDWEGRLLPVAAGRGLPGAVTLNADATIFRASLLTGRTIEHEAGEEGKAFIYVANGRLSVNDTVLGPGDQARVESITVLSLGAKEDSSFVLIDLP